MSHSSAFPAPGFAPGRLLATCSKIGPSNRRAFPRLQKPLVARITRGTSAQHLTVTDISECGLSFRSVGGYKNGEELTVELQLFPGAPQVRLKAAIRYLDSHRTGVQFVNLHLQQRLELADFLYPTSVHDGS